MKHDRNKKASSSGFSLTELLVVIVIIAVLAALGFMGISSLTKRANAAKDSSTMRQMWTSIQMYSGDHNDLMPGPLFSRQAPIYSKPIPTNPRDWRRLSDCLAPYLGYDDPKRGEFIEPMAASWQKTPESQIATAYFMQQDLPIGDGQITQNPWGIPAPATADLRNPMKMSLVMGQPHLSRTWAFTEFDQLHPGISNPDLKKGSPEGMTHGNYRLGMYFDGSIGRLDINNKPL